MCRDIHARSELCVCLFDRGIYFERTVGFVYFLSDGDYRAVECLRSHPVDAELDETACLYLCKVFFVSSQAEHRGAFVNNLTKSFSRIDVFAYIHCHIGCIAADGGFHFQQWLDAVLQQCLRVTPKRESCAAAASWRLFMER